MSILKWQLEMQVMHDRKHFVESLKAKQCKTQKSGTLNKAMEKRAFLKRMLFSPYPLSGWSQEGIQALYLFEVLGPK